jgi:phage terminase small subunit
MQKRFVDEYLIDLNATAAAQRAGYSDPNWGRALLTKPNVADKIAERQRDRQIRTEVTQDRVVLELARLGFSDVRKLFDADGNLLPMNAWPEDTAPAVSSVKVRQEWTTDEDGNKVKETVKEVRLWDKNSALEKIGKHLGLFVERLKVDGGIEIKWQS